MHATRLVALVVMASLGALGAAPAAAQSPVIVKFATANVGDNPRNQAAEQFAGALTARSNGKLKGEVYINNQLARGESAMLEGIQLGTIDVAPVGSAPIGGIFEPGFMPLDLPFLWTSREQVWRVMEGPIGAELAKRMEQKGLKTLCWGGGWGFRNMLSNVRAINTPDDLKGQTIRVQESPTYVAMMKELGANPVPMPYGEVYLAMKQGTVDGMELPVFTLVSDKFVEVTKYYSLTKHTYPPIAWFANLRKYQALSPELRGAMDEAAAIGCKRDREAELEKEKTDLAAAEKAGVKINEVKDLGAFQARMKPAYDLVATKAGKDWLDKVVSAAKAAQ